MNLRCYLRGLGIGIIVTALLMGLSVKESEMSDDKIIARAKQLGMIDGSATLAEEAEEQLEKIEQNMETDNSVEDENTLSETEEKIEEEVLQDADKSALDEKLEEDLLGIRETGDEEEVSESDEQEEIEQQPERNEPQDSDEQTEQNEQQVSDVQTEENAQTEDTSYTLEIRSGDTSVSVSRKLVELGLIENASDYDLFLCSNGYDKKICTGTYEINNGASHEEIARIITKQN